MPRLTLEDMRDLAVAVLMNSNVSADNAKSVAEALAAAELDGLASHGLSRLPAYADQAKSGKVDGHAAPVVSRTAAASIRVDAKSGFAYPAIRSGLDAVEGVIGETGVAACAIGNSHHGGVLGHPVERMAEKGHVALGFANSPEAIAPWGGSRAIFGTNPIAFGCPRENAPVLVIDTSMSKVARGRIKLAADKGESIPEGWAVDGDGNATTDARAAMSGSLLPMGGAKGAALVLMVEILAASLTGSNHGFEASSFFTDDGPPPHIGQFFIVIDPARFAGGAAFAERVETLMTAYLEQAGARLPGQRRRGLRREALNGGVEVPDGLYNDLKSRADG